MTSLPRAYAKALRKQAHMHAAFPPINNAIRMGDYGLYDRGIFESFGNIESKFGVAFTTRKGPPAKVELSIGNTVLVRHQGNATVNVFEAVDVDAELEIKFTSENSVVLKAPRLEVTQMEDLVGVAEALRNHADWTRKWKVVWKVYDGRDVTALGSRHAGTSAKIKAKASVLKELESSWKAGGEIEVSTSGVVELKYVGESGLVGLGLFTLGFFTGQPGLEAAPEDLHAIPEEDWDVELGDDL